MGCLSIVWDRLYPLKSIGAAEKKLQLKYMLKQVSTKGENITPVKQQWQNITNTKANKLPSQGLNWIIRKWQKVIIRLLPITAREKVLIIFWLKKEVEAVDGKGSRRHWWVGLAYLCTHNVVFSHLLNTLMSVQSQMQQKGVESTLDLSPLDAHRAC